MQRLQKGGPLVSADKLPRWALKAIAPADSTDNGAQEAGEAEEEEEEASMEEGAPATSSGSKGDSAGKGSPGRWVTSPAAKVCAAVQC